MSVCYNIEEGLKAPLSYTYLFLFHNEDKILPSEIACFKNLTKIIVDGGLLEELPDEIGELSSLERLHLSGNRLTSLPESLRSCSKLSLVYLDNNRFTSLPPWLGSLSKLTDLLIGGNNIEEIPPSLGKLNKLKVFSCRANSISTLPEELGGWKSLEQLGIETNCFTELPEAVSSMTNLRYLSMAGNRIDSIPDSISELTHLEYFWSRHNRFIHFPEAVLTLPKLIETDLSSNKIQDVDFTGLAGNTRIDLRGNPLSTRCRMKFEAGENDFTNIRIKRLSRGKKEAVLFKTLCNTKGIIYKINRTLLNEKIVSEANLSPDAEFFSCIDLRLLSDKKRLLLSRLRKKYFSFLDFLKLLGFTDIDLIYKTQSLDDWGKHLFTKEQMNGKFLGKKLKSSNPLTREQAVYGLSEIGEPSRYELFCSLFPEENMVLNSFLLEQMAGAHYQPAFLKLCSLIENTDNDELLKLSISNINRFEMADTKEILLSLLNRDNSTSVKTGTLMALLKYPGAHTASAVLPLLFAPEPPVRYMAEYVFRQQDEKAYLIFLEELDKRAAQLVNEEQTDWYRLADIMITFKGEEEILEFLNSKREEITLMGLQLVEKARYSRGVKKSLFQRAQKAVQSLITSTDEKVGRAAEKTIRLIN